MCYDVLEMLSLNVASATNFQDFTRRVNFSLQRIVIVYVHKMSEKIRLPGVSLRVCVQKSVWV